MSLQPMTPDALADTPTIFASFMGEGGARKKTVRELLEIYRERSKSLRATEDRDDDLRVERFMDDMANERWRDEVIMRIGVFAGTTLVMTLVIDGIHRAIAYLACVEQGISSERLPALCVER
jgi:hypothetical protein